MGRLSLAMIVKNEELTLGRILSQAAQFCDEMIIVDTGSTDRTVEIAENLGAKVHYFKWVDDFAAARNYSFSLCTGDWIIWFDADDNLPEKTIDQFKYIKENYLKESVEVNSFMIPYIYAYNAEDVPQLKLNRERIVRRSCGFKWEGRVHETINLNGEPKIGHLFDVIVEHRTDKANEPRKEGRNLKIYEQYLDVETASLHDLFQYAGEYHNANKFDKAAVVYEKYLEQFAEKYGENGGDTMGERYAVCVKLADCYRQLGNIFDALKAAARGISLDGTRAEAYGLLGVTHYGVGNYQAAVMALLAANAGVAPKHGGLTYQAFYGQPIRDMLKEAQTALEASDVDKTSP